MITHSRPRAVGLAGLVLLLCGLLATPASARPIVHEHFRVTDTRDEDMCPDDPGFELFVDVHGSAMVNTKGPDGLPYGSLNVHGVNVWTNKETGKTVTARFDVADRELHLVDNHDGTGTITWQAAYSQRLFGPDGKLLSLRSGLVRGQVVIDLEATDPEAELIEESIILGPTGRFDHPELEDTTSCEQLLLHTS